MKIKKIFLILVLTVFAFNTSALEDCRWDNKKGIPCLTVSKTPNTSMFSKEGINKTIITKQDIISSGALDTNDVLKLIPGIDVFQSGQKGQQTSIFTRGSESNHTLVLLNGIAINDQSVTDVFMILVKILFKRFRRLRFIKELMVHTLVQALLPVQLIL